MLKKHPLLIVLAAGFILLLSGIGTSYYWLTHIYIPEQINSNENAKKLQTWTLNDTFLPPTDSQITESQLEKFIQINQNLHGLLKKLKKEYSESQWQTILEMIKLQPEWRAQKYLSLKKYGMSPLEYEFVTDQITQYWILRFKEKYAEQLNEMGWEMLKEKMDSTIHSENYNLFFSKEEQLNNLFTLFLTEDLKNIFSDEDSLFISSDSLP